MKNIISVLKVFSLALALYITSPAGKAEAVMVSGDAFVTPNSVQATFCNNGYDVPLRCHAKAVGQLNTGLWIHAFTDLYLAPGQCEYAYVYANYPFFFINGSGVGNCILAY